LTSRDVALGAGLAATFEFIDQKRHGEYNIGKLVTAASTGGWVGYKSSGKGLVQQMWYSGIGAGVNTGLNNVLFGENNSVLLNAGVNVAGTMLGGKAADFTGARAYSYFKARGNSYMTSVGYSRMGQEFTSNGLSSTIPYIFTDILKP
jgi:hypothetical protein